MFLPLAISRFTIAFELFSLKGTKSGLFVDGNMDRLSNIDAIINR